MEVKSKQKCDKLYRKSTSTYNRDGTNKQSIKTKKTETQPMEAMVITISSIEWKS